MRQLAPMLFLLCGLLSAFGGPEFAGDNTGGEASERAFTDLDSLRLRIALYG